jgi:peroxiredoxin
MIPTHLVAFPFAVAALLGVGLPVRAAPALPGDEAPDFTLTDTDGRQHHLADCVADGKTVVLEWFNPDCPFVKKHHKTFHTMTDLHHANPDIVWLAINSGAPGKQGSGLERNRRAKQDYGMDYPILLDEDGTVGRLYGAKTTPHMFVISKGRIVYDGAIDDNPSPSGDPGKTNHVAAALAQLGHGEEVSVSRTKSYGCSVKYGSPVRMEGTW